MKAVSHSFHELVRDFASEHWNEDDLAKLSGGELQALTSLSFHFESSDERQNKKLQPFFPRHYNNVYILCLYHQKFIAFLVASISD
jgi:hypothetical protein